MSRKPAHPPATNAAKTHQNKTIWFASFLLALAVA
jgi:hypothetical protein